MKKAVILFVWFFLISIASIVTGQDVSLSILDVHSTPSGNVQMIISILDEEGSPIKGLSKPNVALNVEGKEIKEFSIVPVSSAKSPLSVIIGLDVSGSMKGVPISEAKKAASAFLDQLDKEDFTALMIFGSSVRFLTDFTQNKHEIREKIDGLTASEDWTWLYQATYEAAGKASNAPTSRSTVVLLTDGKDEGSHRTEESIIDKVQNARIPIYTIGFGPNAQIEYLKNVAGISGGYFFSTPDAGELSKLYDMIAKQLRNQYLIEFNFSNPPGDYVSAVTINYRGKAVTARRGFMHVIAEKQMPLWREFLNKYVAWGVLVLVLIIAGAALPYLLRRPLKQVSSESRKEKPEAGMMIDKKIHPIGFSSGNIKDFTKTVIKLSSRGEVGLEIDIPPIPIHFALIDKKNKKEFEEVIITRYDEKRDNTFSKEKIYLLLSDNSISRPEDGREGHARIIRDAKTGTYKVEDMGSTSGTKIKDSVLSKGEPITLEDGDKITVGNITLTYYDKRTLSETSWGIHEK